MNAKHPSWDNPRTNINGRLLLEDLQLGIFTVHHPPTPTHVPSRGSASTLDIFLSNLPSGLSVPETIRDLDSDHYPVSIRVGALEVTKPTFTRRNYHHVDWERFRRSVDVRLNPPAVINSRADVDDTLATFVQAVQTSVAENVKEIPVRNNVLGIDSYTKLLIGKRNAYVRQFQRSRNPNVKKFITRLRKIISIRLNRLYAFQ